MRSLAPTLLSLVLFGTLAACSDDEPEAPVTAETVAETPATEKPQVEAIDQQRVKEPQGVVTASGPVVDPGIRRKLEKVLRLPVRSAQHMARDVYRHPQQTLEFFGLQQSMTVLEITPGEGWYAEILAPLLKQMGRYSIAVVDEKSPAAPEYARAENRALEARFHSQPKYFSRVAVQRFDPRTPVLGQPGTVDMVLTFRNAHNWVEEGTAEAHFKAMASVLKPGGVLGLVDHRAPEGPATDGKTGYVTEEQIIELAVTAGFVLAERSEVNANPKDTRDHPDGVWSLPPTLASGDADRAKYLAIGESDRMTLKFLRQ
jgi:predicted methyltransferase